MELTREYLKGEKKTKINMAVRLLSRVAFHLLLSFLFGTSVHKKRQKICCNILVIWLNSGDNSHLLSPRQQRGKGVVRDRTRRKWQSDHGVLFLIGGFALSSLCNETPKTAGMSEKAQLTPVNKHHCVTKRDGSHVRNPLEAATRIRLVV